MIFYLMFQINEAYLVNSFKAIWSLSRVLDRNNLFEKKILKLVWKSK